MIYATPELAQPVHLSGLSRITIRMAVSSVREAGRATQGVRLIRLNEDDDIAAIARVPEDEEDGDGENSGDGEQMAPPAL